MWSAHIQTARTTQVWSLKKIDTQITPGQEKLRLKRRKLGPHKPLTWILNSSVWVACGADVYAFYCKHHPLGTIVRLGACVFLKFALAFANGKYIFLLLLHSPLFFGLPAALICVRSHGQYRPQGTRRGSLNLYSMCVFWTWYSQTRIRFPCCCFTYVPFLVRLRRWFACMLRTINTMVNRTRCGSWDLSLCLVCILCLVIWAVAAPH